jgi:CheY-like chemotaxis protein
VSESDSGLNAIQMMDRIHPRLIVTDITMPDMDGFAFIDRLKAHSKWCDIPIAVVTGIELSADQRENLAPKVLGIWKKADGNLHTLIEKLC